MNAAFSLPHLIVAPVVLPLVTAALMLLLEEKRRRLKTIVNVASFAAGLGVAATLLLWADEQEAPGVIGVHLLANWEAPFGIVLAVDRLSAMMLVLSATIGLGIALFSTAGWFRAGVHFHPLLQLQLMGLNGAFLTADLFNLFVFFEVTLAASYGLLLHGSGWHRVRSGLHYIAVNLLASSLFLVGIALLYGVTGTLNMADLARRIALVPDADRGLLHAGAALLATAFLTKAAMWPLGFWLVPAYSAASAPVAALFALMTKMGVYTLLRLWALFFPDSAGVSALFGAEALALTGLAAMVFGTLGLLASQSLARVAGFSLIVSSGTLLTAFSLDLEALTSGALFYLLSSTLGISALFLLVDLIERARQGVPSIDAMPVGEHGEDVNLDDQEEALFGRVIPASTAFLGLSFFACALVVAGLPPLSGFIGKIAILAALLDSSSVVSWALFAMLIVSGFASLITLSRAGMRHFWTPVDRPPPRLRLAEGAPVVALLVLCIGLTAFAEPVLRFTRRTAAQLHRPAQYIEAVLSAQPEKQP